MAPGKVWQYLQGFFSEHKPLHLTLIDPDPLRQSIEEASEIARLAEKAGSNVIMIGGSTGTSTVNQTTKAINDAVTIPVITFPGNVDALCPYADAMFFMSLLNSTNPYFIIGAQAIGAFSVKMFGLETISMGYLIVEPGATAGFIGEAKLLPRTRPQIAAAYALAAEYMGFKLVYLEAGSGAENAVPPEMVQAVSKVVSIPIIVGGGIESPEQAKRLVAAGANGIVQGTFVERSIRQDKGKRLELIIKTMQESGKHSPASPK